MWKRFVKDLKEHATKIFNYEKKEMIPLTDEKNKSYEKQKVTYAEKNLILMMRVIKSIIKLEIIVITQEHLEKLAMIFAI